MKIKKAIDICKKSGQLTLYGGALQWLSDGNAFYPLFEMPTFDEGSICAAYDIPEKQRQRIEFHIEGDLPEQFYFGDFEEGEAAAIPESIYIHFGGRDLIPYHTSAGVVFVDARYLAPFAGEEDIELHERKNKYGMRYFAVKKGFMLIGIVNPFFGVDERLCASLRRLADEIEQTYGKEKQNENES